MKYELKNILAVDQSVLDKFLDHPSERFTPGTIRNLIAGAAITIVFVLDKNIIMVIRWEGVIGILFTGWLIAFMGWGSERLWCSTIGTMLNHPFAWYAYITRVPFWFIAGGVAYTTGILLSARAKWLLVHDIPVRDIFISGGLIEFLLQFVMQIRVVKFIKRLTNKN